MGFVCGIVGLPNVGKSTLFNAVTSSGAGRAENFPFCTIEPNSARVPVMDARVDQVADIARSAQRIPAVLGVEDIAGLVRGASRGEGLGNKFLGHIREVDAILHVLRCFESDQIIHVEGGADPVRDAEIVETELMLVDLESVERRFDGQVKRARGGDRDAKTELPLLEALQSCLREGIPARLAEIPTGSEQALHQIRLLSAKPVLYVCNVAEDQLATGNALADAALQHARANHADGLVVSAAVEAEIALLEDESERDDFLASLGLKHSGLDRLILAGYNLLQLLTFFTAGPKEARAWTIGRGTQAPQAAGRIHSDIERGFITAEIIGFDDYVACAGESGAREKGKLRLEGRDYRMQEGDVAHFRFNV